MKKLPALIIGLACGLGACSSSDNDASSATPSVSSKVSPESQDDKKSPAEQNPEATPGESTEERKGWEPSSQSEDVDPSADQDPNGGTQGRMSIEYTPPEGWDFAPDNGEGILVTLENPEGTHWLRIRNTGLPWDSIDDPAYHAEIIGDNLNGHGEYLGDHDGSYWYDVESSQVNMAVRYLNANGIVVQAVIETHPDYDPMEYIEVLESVEITIT